MTVVQSIATKGARQNAQARNLIGNVQASPMSIRQTVERWSAEDVFSEENVILVRSKFSAHRYFQVLGNACSCKKENCPHIAKANAYRAANVQEVEEVKQPSPSQARKMVQVDSAEKVIVQGDAILVQSCRFIGWAYTVTFNYARAQYVCSCGNPKCTEHINAVKEYTAKKAPLPCSVEWYKARREEERAAEIARKAEEALIAQIRETFARVVVTSIAANINTQFSKVVVQRGIQKEAA